MPEDSVLRNSEIPYRRLGLARNPFPAIPICGENDHDLRSKYLVVQAKRLKQLIRSSSRRKNAVYVVGVSGTGKSSLFRVFRKMYSEHPYIYPLLVPFPFYGGISALYNSALRRIPSHHLSRVLQSYEKLGASWAWFNCAKYDSGVERWQTVRGLEADSWNGIYMFEAMIDGLTRGIGRRIVALLADDIEYAWDRFVGWQKYHWGGNVATLCHDLGPKLVWVFSVNPDLSGPVLERSMPYFQGVVHWKIRGEDVNLLCRIGATQSNTLTMDVDHEELRVGDIEKLLRKASRGAADASVHKEVLDKVPKPLPAMGKVLLQLHELIRQLAYGRSTRVVV